ncbi:FRG domain protein [Citrifermentans bemidjiense Bem]|uniref:FRG domain protein n=1 Tax=Citrifermentans bemidjiense (strain ATCC BAA-1014 / DSM 16622 / JCM 12645 / Bem) TaxID=404380 RepID=B5E8A9_CITBB|nr:FRG domain-containing protein [Citrifermentans bemidjiense]ACH37092.1 FRG domain protein [Citrifermentans bemidjiense Bem]
MHVVNLATWEEFEGNVFALYQLLHPKVPENKSYVSPLLFRGHSNASWLLETTLERVAGKCFRADEYYNIMLSVQPAIQSFTEKTWEFAHSYPNDDGTPKPPPGYEFMAYLRHHGFPSPLLDWSRSPYIAAFFAFQSPELHSHDDNVAIYVFVEYLAAGKSGMLSEATIIGCGPHVTTHKRHFNQQSEYTICRKIKEDRVFYCCHEEAFARDEGSQDLLFKYILPRSERGKVLERLHMMNITAYSLYGSEDSLISTLAYQEINRKRRI